MLATRIPWFFRHQKYHVFIQDFYHSLFQSATSVEWLWWVWKKNKQTHMWYQFVNAETMRSYRYRDICNIFNVWKLTDVYTYLTLALTRINITSAKFFDRWRHMFGRKGWNKGVKYLSKALIAICKYVMLCGTRRGVNIECDRVFHSCAGCSLLRSRKSKCRSLTIL